MTRVASDTWDAIRMRAARAWSLLVALIAVGCGARTGLDAPCTIALAPATTRVVVVVDHSVFAGIPFQQVFFAGGGSTYLLEFGLVVGGLEVALPALEADPLRAPTATGLYVFPEIGPDQIQHDGLCATPTALRLPIAPDGVAPVLAQLLAWDDGSGNEDYSVAPAGGEPVYAALGLAQAALDADGGQTGPRFVVFESEGGSNCNAGITPAECTCDGLLPASCLSQPEGVLTCSDESRIVAMVTTMLQTDEIPTLLVGDDSLDMTSFAPHEAFRTAIAIAGGRPRSGPRAWYGIHETDALMTALRTQVAPAGWCWPHAVRPPADPENWGLGSATRGPIARDSSHVEGWDWVDPAAGTLRLYGAACDAAIADRGGLQLVAQHQWCPP